MGRVMTEDFVENKQEAEVVNNGTEKAGSSMGVVGSISKNKIFLMKNWYFYLFVVLFIADPVVLFMCTSSSFVIFIAIAVLITWFMFTLFLFELRILYKYSDGIGCEKMYRGFFLCFVGMYIIYLSNHLLHNGNQTRIMFELFFPYFILTCTGLSLSILRVMRFNMFSDVPMKVNITKKKAWLLVVCMSLFDLWLISWRYSDSFYSVFILRKH